MPIQKYTHKSQNTTAHSKKYFFAFNVVEVGSDIRFSLIEYAHIAAYGNKNKKKAYLVAENQIMTKERFNAIFELCEGNVKVSEKS